MKAMMCFSPDVHRFRVLAIIIVLILAGCTPSAPSPAASDPTPRPAVTEPAPPQAAGTQERPAATLPTPNLPTATLPPTPAAEAGRYTNRDLGISFTYPRAWTAEPGEDETTLTWLIAPFGSVLVLAFYSPMPADASLEQAATQIRDSTAVGVSDVRQLDDAPFTLADGREAWKSEYTGIQSGGTPVHVILSSAARGGRLFTLMAFGEPAGIERERQAIEDMAASMRLEAPAVYGLPRDQTLVLLGGESTNPRAYDPANGGGDDLVFTGLVSLNPALELVPELAESWEISDDGTVYTFHLRRNARFHDGRPVTAQDVIYSWERAADPATDSDTVLTYLGDIVGVREKHAGAAGTIRGLRAIDDHTLEVTIDVPKPYFLLKLTYGTAAVVDRANVEAGPEWYRTPNGTGPYRLIRWDRFELQLYERNEDYYLGPPAIRYIVNQLFSGVGIRMYETGDIDITGISLFNAERVRDPGDPLNADLREGVSMCTSFVRFDVTQPPFDDPGVRQAFALAIDKQAYLDVVLQGVGLTAHGLYPPALPGYTPTLQGLDFDPDLARRRLSESSYGGADNLPPIVFTSSGFGSDVGPSVSALAQMWQDNLGVTIVIENIEPNVYVDALHDGDHGQLFLSGWCADYPDPENFADALFHSGAQQNLGNYANPELDQLLEAARIEPDVQRRLERYQQAEELIVEDAAAIFLNHSLSFALVKPYIEGYVLTPIAVPIERYLSIDAGKMDGGAAHGG